ncbi:hypothetical protein D3C72_2538690 [compost metagenome]
MSRNRDHSDIPESRMMSRAVMLTTDCEGSCLSVSAMRLNSQRENGLRIFIRAS